VKLPGCIQVFRVVAFVNADHFLMPVSGEQGLQPGPRLWRLRNSLVAIILAERVVTHDFIFNPNIFFCQIPKMARKLLF
jgi:hypothetical protein